MRWLHGTVLSAFCTHAFHFFFRQSKTERTRMNNGKLLLYVCKTDCSILQETVKKPIRTSRPESGSTCMHALFIPVCLYVWGGYTRGKSVFVCEALAKLHLWINSRHLNAEAGQMDARVYRVLRSSLVFNYLPFSELLSKLPWSGNPLSHS